MKLYFLRTPSPTQLSPGWIRRSIDRSITIDVALYVGAVIYFFIELRLHSSTLEDFGRLVPSCLILLGFFVGFLLHELLHMLIPPIPSRLRRVICGIGLSKFCIPSPWVSVEGIQTKWQYMLMIIAPFVCLGLFPLPFISYLAEGPSVYFWVSLTTINIAASAWDINLFRVVTRTQCDQVIDEEKGFSYHPVP